MSEMVRIRYEKDVDGHRLGDEFEVVSAERAREVHPKAKILSYATGEPYVAPKPEPKDEPSPDDAPPKKAASKAKDD